MKCFFAKACVSFKIILNKNRIDYIFIFYCFSTNVSSSLFIVTSPFQETLLAVQSLCKDLCMCTINKKSDKYLSFLQFELSLVNKLDEFCKIHELRCQEIRKSIQVIREDVLKLVLATCKVR